MSAVLGQLSYSTLLQQLLGINTLIDLTRIGASLSVWNIQVIHSVSA